MLEEEGERKSPERLRLFAFLGFVVPVGSLVWLFVDGFLGNKLPDSGLIFWTVVVTLFLWFAVTDRFGEPEP